jgi:hypothetical protein
MANGLRPFALPRPDALSPPLLRSLRWRIIPDNMRIPSPAGWPYRDGAMLNFAITEF